LELFDKKTIFKVIMEFLRLKAIFILLFVLSGWLILQGQSTEGYLSLEKEADSLATAEKHQEAVLIYKFIIKEYGKSMDSEERLLVDYKTGYSLMHSGEDIEAMRYFRNVISGSRKLSSDTLVNDAMTGLGKTYEYTGKHDSAFFWYLKAYKEVRESSDTLRRARDARNMAQLLRVLNRFDEARIYCLKALDLIQGIRDYKVIANIYNETAYLFELSHDLDSAAYFYEKLIDLSIVNEYSKGVSTGYSNLASVYEKEGRFEEAVALKRKGLEIDRGINDTYGMMASYCGLASTYLLTRDYEKALKALDNALALCDTSWLPDMSGIIRIYYEIYRAMGQYEIALEYYEAYNNLRNRINQAESRKQVSELLVRFDTEKKEQQIKILEQANQIKEDRIKTQWIIIGALSLLSVFIMLTGWLWIRNKNQKLKQINSELQNLILREEQASSRDGKETITPEPSEIYTKWGLTGRESEILYYLGKGYSNTAIGEKLFISANTVKFHIKNIYLKLDVKNRIQALLRCSDNNTADI
jgi:DNA-binding CsgD family transcriptional regulator